MSESPPKVSSFSDLELPASIMAAINEIGYETPSPIQTEAIPLLLKGHDLIGRAPTGTGKTAAFALPLLSRLDMTDRNVQVMVLAPTRELAIQVAEAFQRYASHIKGFHVLPIYGGQDYAGQIRQLKRGVQVVVGTPGRVMDHMGKGRLKLGGLKAMVLDEADEMLRMGFIDDVEWILDQTPPDRQMALFSATMPNEIKRIARKHLKDAQEVAIKARTATADTIRQRYWMVSGLHKLDALTRILEVETFDAILMFVRTRVATTRLAEKLEARGYACAALNGDMAQNQREQMIARLKSGSLDILVATDVAARGLDVERISHVVNYDIPNGTESYIHRIGRTGRAGRQGEAILFVAPRERRMLNAIEKATRQKIEPLVLPTVEMVSNKRIADFKQGITDTLATEELGFVQGLLEQYQQEHNVPAMDIASALAKMSLGDNERYLKPDRVRSEHRELKRESRQNTSGGRERSPQKDGFERRGAEKGKRDQKRETSRQSQDHGRPRPGMDRYRIEVGSMHDVKPANIVGAIANEAGLDSRHIGNIEILDESSLVDLPKGMPLEVFLELKKAWVCGRQLNISRMERVKNKPDEDRSGRSKPAGRKKSADKGKRKKGKKRK